MLGKITRNGYNKCLLEVNEIKQKIVEVIKRIHEARKNGDFSENAELHAELKTKRHLDMHLSKLLEITTSWEVINVDEVDASKVQIGATVVLVCGSNQLQYQIVGDYESDITKNKICYKSLFAKQLISKKQGDVIDYMEKKYTIKSINYDNIN